MRYADAETVFHMLEIEPDTAGADELIALDNLESAVAATIDAKCNRTFDGGPLASTRTLDYAHYGIDYYTDRIVTQDGLVFFADFYLGHPNPYISAHGLKNVTAISVGGVWDGSIWSGAETLATSLYQLAFERYDGWYQGIVIPAYRYADIRVTAEWENTSSAETIPADIREAATFILIDEWRIRHMSPAGEIGPAGLAIYLRNTWEYEMVKTAINHHRYRPLIV